MLHIAENLDLPDDEAVTQTFAILAKRGKGKTYTASVMTEELLKANRQVIVVDPVGVWWGLRAAADGKGPGLPIVIAGGDHADIPLDPKSGEQLADIVVDHRLSIVLDFSLLRKNEQTRFMTDFAETLYRRNRNAVHLVLDEADAFAPQRPFGDESRMLGAVEDIVRRGRARGIGVTMITQRPSVLNKNVLTQIEVLIALGLTAPLDQKAVDEWVKTHAEEGQREQFMTSLPSLPIGTAWFWSPGWLNIFQKVQVRKRETFDSSSTPKAGNTFKEPQTMANVNIAEIRDLLAAEDAPEESGDILGLKRHIKQLQKEVAAKPKVEVREVVKTVVPVDELKRIIEDAKDAEATLQGIRMLAEQLLRDNKVPTTAPVATKSIPAQSVSGLSPDAEKILQAAVNGYPMKFTYGQLASLAGLPNSGANFLVPFAALKRKNLLQEEDGLISATDSGMIHLGVIVKPLPKTIEETIDMWRSALREGELRIFDELYRLYPRALSFEDLGKRTGYAPRGGAFLQYVGSLRRNSLVETQDGKVTLNPKILQENT